jgi:hypothetical protein
MTAGLTGNRVGGLTCRVVRIRTGGRPTAPEGLFSCRVNSWTGQGRVVPRLPNRAGSFPGRRRERPHDARAREPARRREAERRRGAVWPLLAGNPAQGRPRAREKPRGCDSQAARALEHARFCARSRARERAGARVRGFSGDITVKYRRRRRLSPDGLAATSRFLSRCRDHAIAIPLLRDCDHVKARDARCGHDDHAIKMTSVFIPPPPPSLPPPST